MPRSVVVVPLVVMTVDSCESVTGMMSVLINFRLPHAIALTWRDRNAASQRNY
jgi:hypothetical protein